MRPTSRPNLRFVGEGIVILWGMSLFPGVAAEEVCYTTIEGFWRCTKRLSIGARIAIGLGASILFSVILTLCLCVGIRRHRARRQEAIASVYQVDASQIEGPPPTTYVTSFDPRSPANYPLPNSAYLHDETHDPPTSFPKTPAGYANTPDSLSAIPRSPLPSARSPHVRFKSSTEERFRERFSKSPQTAPVNPPYQTQGAYPFRGYSSRSGAIQQPQTAYSGHAFPRPLYTGQKDRDHNGIV